jgi:hypothetical protein
MTEEMKKKFGTCLVCGGDIVKESNPFQSMFVCNGCGIAYNRITDKNGLKHTKKKKQ